MGLRDRIVNERARSAQSALDGSEIYRRRLLEEVDFGELAELTESQRRVRLERIVGGMLTREGPVMTTSQRQALIRRVIDEAVGLGVLEPLLADETVTEIMVNGPREVWVERDGRIERAHAEFTSEAQLCQTIDRIVSQVDRRVDESSPMVDARLPNGERVNVIVPPLSLVGPVLTIRRFRAGSRCRSWSSPARSTSRPAAADRVRPRAAEHRRSRAEPAPARPRC